MDIEKEGSTIIQHDK